jgi:Flp pilus assembly protein TadD
MKTNRLEKTIILSIAVACLSGCSAFSKKEQPEAGGMALPKFSDFGRDFTSGQSDYSTLLARARAHDKAGKPEEAREVYEQLIADYPDRATAFHRYGVSADRQRRHREAQELLTRAVQLEPRNAEMLNDLGYCLYLQGQLAKAESAILKSAKLDPSRNRTWNNLGIVLGQQGRYEDSLNAFRQAGSEADAQYNLAFVYSTHDQISAAKDCFQRALAADPQHEKSRRALDAFEQYEGVARGDGHTVGYANDSHSMVLYNESSAAAGQTASPIASTLPPSAKAVTAARNLHRQAREAAQQQIEAGKAQRHVNR